jgi:recombination protein RecA
MSKDKEIKSKEDIADLDKVMKEINKECGDLIKLGSETNKSIESLTTGSIALDNAIGIGGFPKGRIVEIYGPEASGKTTIALGAVACAQRDGYKVAFLDMEHALDPKMAKGIGVDWPNLLFSQPNYGEQCLDIACKLIATGKLGIVVIDSVAALIPKVELDGEMTDVQMGAMAKMMAKGLRKLVPVCQETGTILIFINQLREKIGVMFGCLHADTLVNFVDGRSIKIKDIVDNKIGGEVWSYDEQNNKFVTSKIIGWHNNGNIKDKSDYLSIYLRCPENKNGFVNITVTPDHKILTDNGWIESEKLCIGSKVLTKQESILNGSLGSFLYGALAGDSHIAQIGNHFSASLKIRDNINLEYAKWKVSKLTKIMNFSEINVNSGVLYSSRHFSELTDIKNNYYNRDPMLLLNNFNWLGFAIWMMDDACYNRSRYQLSIKRFKGDFDKIDEISGKLDDLGLYHHSSYGGKITFDKNISDKIAENIAKYVPECMRHKLPSGVLKYQDFELNREFLYSSTYAEVVDIREASDKQMKNIGKYDISVENYHNYSAGGSHNGVIVHNSPETQPGGKALRFAASIRLDVRRIEQIKDGDRAIGNRLRVKVIKNKVAEPHHVAEVDLYFGKGIDNLKDIIESAVELNIITKKGASYYEYGEIKVNGKDKLITALNTDQSKRKELEDSVRARAGELKVVIESE